MKTVSVVKTKKAKKTDQSTILTYDENMEYFVGIDLHKKFMQVAVMGSDGNIIQNDKIECDYKIIQKAFSKFPKNAKYVIESSSVWYGMYKFLRDELKLDVMLSNPFATKVIATSKKKTDKVDAKILADLLRGGYIMGCYVPKDEIVKDRQLIRCRDKMVTERTKFKNQIHGILLQEGIKIAKQPFSFQFNLELKKIDDWRIDKYLNMIQFLNKEIEDCNIRLNTAVRKNKDACLLTTVPGIGNVVALALVSGIGDISRFPDANHLAAYFGLVPSVRNSASTVHHGSITKRGASLIRKLLAESAIVHVTVAKKNNKPTLISEFYNRLAEKRGGSKAKVAAAAKILRVVFWMLSKEIDFETCMREGKKSTYRKKPKKKKQVQTK